MLLAFLRSCCCCCQIEPQSKWDYYLNYFRTEIEKDAKSLFLFTVQLGKLRAIYFAGHIARKIFCWELGGIPHINVYSDCKGQHGCHLAGYCTPNPVGDWAIFGLQEMVKWPRHYLMAPQMIPWSEVEKIIDRNPKFPPPIFLHWSFIQMLQSNAEIYSKNSKPSESTDWKEIFQWKKQPATEDTSKKSEEEKNWKKIQKYQPKYKT